MSGELPHRHGRNVTQVGQTKTVMPISPGTLVDLTGFRMRQDLTKRLIADLRNKKLNVFVIADIHET